MFEKYITRILLSIPAFIGGALFGIFFFAIVPLLVFATIWYGGEAYRHPDALDFLFRPAAFTGGCIGVLMVWSLK